MTTDPAHTGPPGLAAELFDCVQVNLAVTADRAHGPGTGLRLGACLAFTPSPGPNGLPTVEPAPRDQITEAVALLGLRVREFDERPAADVVAGPGCLIVADAHDLPWVPYFGQRHLPHSFLAEREAGGEIGGFDAYHNETPWGPARPAPWTLERADFDRLPGKVLAVRLEPGVLPGISASVEPAADEVIDGYVGAYAAHPDREAALRQLTLETWLLTRARALHAGFRRQGGPAVAEDHLRAWESVTEQVYLACRRVERGRAEPTAVLPRLAELLRADRVAFAAAPESVRDVVAEVAGAVLGVAPAEVLAARSLADFPDFGSFRIVEIVERLEARLDFEFDPDALVPENLHDIDALSRAVLRTWRPGGAKEAA